MEDIRGQFSYQKTKDPLDSVFSPPSLFLNSSVLKDENVALFAEEADCCTADSQTNDDYIIINNLQLKDSFYRVFESRKG